MRRPKALRLAKPAVFATGSQPGVQPNPLMNPGECRDAAYLSSGSCLDHVTAQSFDINQVTNKPTRHP